MTDDTSIDSRNQRYNKRLIIRLVHPSMIKKILQVHTCEKFGQDFVPIFNIFQNFLQVQSMKYFGGTLL